MAARAPRDERKSSDNQLEQAELNALRVSQAGRCAGSRMTNNRSVTHPWLPAEEAELLSLFDAGATAELAAEWLGRTRQAVYARLQRF